MVYDVVHYQPMYRYFRASTCSFAYFVKVLFHTLEILLPLVIIFSTHGLWKKYGEFREIPKVSYEGKYILLLNNDRIDYVLSSSYPVLNLAQHDRVLLAEEAWFWSNPSQLNIQLALPVRNRTIETVMYIILLKYELSYHNLVTAELPLIDTVRLGEDTQELRISGRLKVDQTAPFSGWLQRFIVLNDSRQDFEYYKPSEIMNRIAASDMALRIDRDSSFRVPRSSPSTSDLRLSFSLHVGEDIFSYKTDLWELLKWAWIQYLAIFVIIRLISQNTLTYLFSNNVLEAIPCCGK